MSDLTARARIRDAAIECFAREGFEAPVRTIAARSGVSAGLITHHFGGKDALRAECDAEVLRRYRAFKTEGIAQPSATMLAALASPELPGVLMVYMLRAIQAGGQPASDFLDHLTDEMRPVMAASVAAGLVHPSRDEEARLRYLVRQTMGAMLVTLLTSPEASPEQFVASLRDAGHETLLPMLELLTEGLLVDRGPLEDYLTQLWEPTEPSGAPPGPPPHQESG